MACIGDAAAVLNDNIEIVEYRIRHCFVLYYFDLRYQSFNLSLFAANTILYLLEHLLSFFADIHRSVDVVVSLIFYLPTLIALLHHLFDPVFPVPKLFLRRAISSQ